MDLTPSQLTGATFRTVRKGYDPDEVTSLLARAAAALEQAQQHATAMEARARAAVARLQEATAAATAAPAAAAPTEVRVAPDEAETISRTLLLAQRTADTAIAEARAEAERIAAEARTEAEATLDSTREMSAQLLADARSEARQLTEREREVAANEVEALRARREFLLGDVDHLERFLVDQRDRLRAAARQIEAMCERVPAGLGAVRPPVLSAAADPVTDTVTDPGTDTDAETPGDAPAEPDTDTHTHDTADTTGELVVPAEAAGPFAGIDELVEAIAEAGDTAPVGTGTWVVPDDPGPNVGPGEAPDLPTRRPTD